MEDKKLNWRLRQGLLGMLVAAANASSHRNTRTVGSEDGAQIVTLEGRRYRAWKDADGDEHTSPISEGDR